MALFRKILCPTDFSQPSYEALKVANELSLHFSSDLYLVHVISPIPVPPGVMNSAGFNIPAYVREVEENSKKLLDEAANQMVSKKVRVHIMTIHGKAADEIIRVADEQEVDLIVIATHGRTGWQHFVFGSVAEKVVRLAKAAVLTVKAPDHN